MSGCSWRGGSCVCSGGSSSTLCLLPFLPGTVLSILVRPTQVVSLGKGAEARLFS